jgi:hypothetical protein
MAPPGKAQLSLSVRWMTSSAPSSLTTTTFAEGTTLFATSRQPGRGRRPQRAARGRVSRRRALAHRTGLDHGGGLDVDQPDHRAAACGGHRGGAGADLSANTLPNLTYAALDGPVLALVLCRRWSIRWPSAERLHPVSWSAGSPAICCSGLRAPQHGCMDQGTINPPVVGCCPLLHGHVSWYRS